MNEREGCDSKTCPVYHECMTLKRFVAISDEELYDLMDLLSGTSDYAVIREVLGIDLARKGEDARLSFEKFLRFHKQCTGKKAL